MISLRPGRIPRRPAVARYPPGTTLGPRTLGDFEFVWVMTGGAEWHWIDGGVRLALEPGTLLLTRPGMRDEFRWDGNAPTRHGYVHFGIDPPPRAEGWPLLRPAISPGPIPCLLDYILWLAEEPVAGWSRHVEGTIETLLFIFLSAPLPDSRPDFEPRALAAALDHVRSEWSARMRPLTLTELSAVARVSKEHLARLFRLRYGTGMIGALELVRLHSAETLLTRTNLSVGEVSSSCGFADPLHFSRRFLLAYGVSPRAYRQDVSRSTPLEAAGLLPLVRRLTAG